MQAEKEFNALGNEDDVRVRLRVRDGYFYNLRETNRMRVLEAKIIGTYHKLVIRI